MNRVEPNKPLVGDGMDGVVVDLFIAPLWRCVFLLGSSSSSDWNWFVMLLASDLLIKGEVTAVGRDAVLVRSAVQWCIIYVDAQLVLDLQKFDTSSSEESLAISGGFHRR